MPMNRNTIVLLALVLCTSAHAAREPLIIDATPATFHWAEGYASGISPNGPATKLGNLSLHLTHGLYGDEVWRPATVAVYDATPDRSRTFMATGYRFEVKACGSRWLILNWTGAMGSAELTLIHLALAQDHGQWRIAEVTMTRHSTQRNTTIKDVAPWADECVEAEVNR